MYIIPHNIITGRASEHGGIINLADLRRPSLSRSERPPFAKWHRYIGQSLSVLIGLSSAIRPQQLTRACSLSRPNAAQAQWDLLHVHDVFFADFNVRNE